MKNFVCSYIKYLKYALSWYSPYTQTHTDTHCPNKDPTSAVCRSFCAAVCAEVQQPKQLKQRGRCAGYIFIFSFFLFGFFFVLQL